jgi:hypothetical protein
MQSHSKLKRTYITPSLTFIVLFVNIILQRKMLCEENYISNQVLEEERLGASYILKNLQEKGY